MMAYSFGCDSYCGYWCWFGSRQSWWFVSVAGFFCFVASVITYGWQPFHFSAVQFIALVVSFAALVQVAITAGSCQPLVLLLLSLLVLVPFPLKAPI